MSEKLISADKLIMTLESMRGSRTHATIDNIIYNLKIAPAVDAVEVVRCKDCIHFFSIIFGSHCQLLGTQMDKDGYCSCGERREENAVD